MQHNLSKRGHFAKARGLQLRQRTAEHLDTLVEKREYLMARYEPHAPSNISSCTRLEATLSEVSVKVTKMLRRQDKTNAVQKVRPKPALKR